MRLTVLGCAGTFPGPESPCSAYLLEEEGYRLLLDFGNGALTNLQRCGGLLDVDAIVVSHLHGDHCLDLVAYAYARRYHPTAPNRPLPLLAPAGARSRLEGLFDAPPPDLTDVYDFTDAGPGTREVGPFRLELDRMNHPIETFAVRVTAGTRTLAYSADSGCSAELVELARGADAFLCEASFLDGVANPPDVHLTGREAGDHATKAEVQRLLLTHLVPWGDEMRTQGEAASAYDGPLEVVRPCTSYEV